MAGSDLYLFIHLEYNSGNLVFVLSVAKETLL